ncbi:MAG: DNA gyrase subunit A [Chitinophagales bacterium]|nr:DNA gyrase subunit A [Chitinophagales bacterium]
MAESGNIIQINIEDEMKTAYIDYSMSVIVSRAIPDVRDGLKPVHRRVLYGMHDLGLSYNKTYKKSARIVGEVLGKYHPHGDGSVYDAMVRMAQDWSLRYPLVNGQGNFGSVDGDSPAAMRYTEARMQKITDEIIKDIDKNTVDFDLNFDDTLEEPKVLPSKIPTLLVNGASGIAVGMATNILPHNLTEVINGTIAYIDNYDIEIDELMQHITAPDFPTGGTIFGVSGVIESFRTGRGKVVVRGKANFETSKTGKEQIIVTEIPYQVNKATLCQKTADLVNNKKIEGISDIRDESDRNGMRIVFDLKRDAIPNVVLNQLYKYTQLQTSFGVNNVALVKGRPQLLNLKDMIKYFVEFRHEVVVRRTQYELEEAEKKAHILEGLLIALDNLDEVINLIRKADSPENAKNQLMERFELSEIQAKAILDMRLAKLTGLEREKVKNEYEELIKTIAHLKAVLDSEEMRMDIIKEELMTIKEDFGDDRRTDIEQSDSELYIEDLIPDEEVVVTISHLGYVKRTPSVEYKTQGRGGKGSKGGSTRDEDFIQDLMLATTHNYLLLFTEQGKCFWLKVHRIPEGSKTSKGRPIQNLMNIPSDDKVLAYIPIKDLNDEEFLNSNYVVFCTKKGVIKKTLMEKFSRPRTNGIIAIGIREGDQLLEAKLTNGNHEILMATKAGQAIRFPEAKVRNMGRSAAGVRGVKLQNKKDEVVGMVTVDREREDVTIMVVSEKGYGKRSDIDDYRITNRGGKGVRTLNVTDKTGGLISMKSVTAEDDLMIINKSGITIRMSLEEVRVMGRATQGVRLIRLNTNDEIAAVAKVTSDDENDAKENGEGNNENGNEIAGSEEE